MSRDKWFELGILKSPKKPINLSFWRFVILLNWSLDWAWASVSRIGDLRHIVVGILKIRWVGEDEKIFNGFGIYIFKLSITFGYINRN